ncbi:hypothetical protein D3C73_1615430 [compost metagenome]
MLAAVLGDKAEDAFRQSMLFSDGQIGIFWSNPLVGGLTTAALLMLFWPLISKALQTLTGLRKPQVAKPKSVL